MFAITFTDAAWLPGPWAAGAAVLAVGDALWLSVTGSRIYSPLFFKPNGIAPPGWQRVALFVAAYVLLASLAASVFTAGNVNAAAALGALLGALVFGVYNLTVAAYLPKPSVVAAGVDMLYGMVAWTVLLSVQHLVRA
jgi:uncharacterized membrane protein